MKHDPYSVLMPIPMQSPMAEADAIESTSHTKSRCAGKPGFVYVLENDYFGALKIGFSQRHPLDRAKELWTTGVPAPFVVRFAMWSASANILELRAHEHFKDVRVSECREFFDIDLESVVAFLCDAVLEGSSSCVADRHDVGWFGDAAAEMQERSRLRIGPWNVAKAIVDAPEEVIQALANQECDRLEAARALAHKPLPKPPEEF